MWKQINATIVIAVNADVGCKREIVCEWRGFLSLARPDRPSGTVGPPGRF
jgi:hypothetical protein